MPVSIQPLNKYLSLLNACVREPDVERYVAYILTDALCRTKNAPAVFADLIDYANDQAIDLPLEDLQWSCEKLIMAGITNENAEVWSRVANFYRNISHSQVYSLLLMGRVVIDELNFTKHPRLQELFQRFKLPTSEERVTLGGLLAPSYGTTNESCVTAEDIDRFNKEVAPVFFWPDEVIDAFFFDENEEVAFNYID